MGMTKEIGSEERGEDGPAQGAEEKRSQAAKVSGKENLEHGMGTRMWEHCFQSTAP